MSAVPSQPPVGDGRTRVNLDELIGLRARVATYVALMLIAMAITGPGVLLGNHFLHAGVWDQTVAGAPWLVHAVTAAALLGVLLTARGLRVFGVDGPRSRSVAAGR